MTQTANALRHDIRVRVGDAARGIQGSDLQVMRTYNRMLILACLRDRGATPRAEIARFTGLSRTTVGNIVDDLLKDGFVSEGESERAQPSGNRRVIPVHFNARAGWVLGVSIGRHSLTALLCDLLGQIVARIDCPFPTLEGPEVCLPELERILAVFIADQGLQVDELVGLGIGFPGIVAADGSYAAAPPNVSTWGGFNLQQALADTLHIPVYVDNNANLGALGEFRYGAGQGARNLLYVKIGSGIGGGIVIDGAPFRGSTGSAGEIGHMVVDPAGPQCTCGNFGCLEIVAGKAAIIQAVRQEYPAFNDIVDIIAAAQAGNEICIRALERAGENVGRVLAGLINYFNPELVIVDGSSMRAGDLLFQPLQRVVARCTLQNPHAQVRVTGSTLKNLAIALGGVATVLDAAFGLFTPTRFPAFDSTAAYSLPR